MLALLATEDRMTRPRAWVQDKLWSERSSAKASNSLRQTIHQMRLCFPDDPDIVFTDRSVVGLDASRITVRADGPGEFLEGIDLRDQEFEGWLSEERLSRAGPAGAGQAMRPETPALQRHIHRTRRGLAIECANDPYSSLGRFETSFGDTVQQSIRELMDFEPVDPHRTSGAPQDVITLGIHAHHDAGGRICLRLAVYTGPHSGAAWADTATCQVAQPTAPLSVEMRNLCCRASAALSDHLCQAGQGIALTDDANALAGAGIRKMYSMQPGSALDAAGLFQRASEIRSRGLFSALQAQLAVIKFVESGGQNRQDLTEMSDEFCANAMTSEGTNSIVLSSVAHARMVFDNDLETAAELSKLAVTANPSNPMAWSAWANIMLNTDQLDDAAKAARMALGLSKGTYFRYWTEFQYATTAVALGHNAEATRYAERSRALNPRYRPALRYLVGLYANTSQFDHARAAMTRLQKQEAGTTVDRFLNDELYPVKMMRSAGLVDAGKLREIK